MPDGVSKEYLDSSLGAMELRIVREIQTVRELIPDEDNIRVLAREELGLATRSSAGARTAIMAIVTFGVAISSFLMTVFRGSGHA